MRWQDKTVLVTGAGGFVGSHLAERLLDSAARVRAFVRYNSRNDWGRLEMLPKQKLDQIEVVAGDLRDADAIRRLIEKVDIVFHLGSMIAIPYSYVHPRETIETNVMGALNVFSAARDMSVERIIHTSTSEVYGSARYVPIDEKHPLQGQSPYSASKIGADMLAESFYRSFDLPVTIIRPFNTFGPRQSARAIIPTIISQALSDTPEIALGSLEPRRDYTYVDDLVEAFVSIAESPDVLGEVLNIGTGLDFSIGDIAKTVMEIMAINKPIVQAAQRIRPAKSEVDRLCCDNTKAKRLLGWQPRISFEDGLRKTIEWIREHKELYKSELYNV